MGAHVQGDVEAAIAMAQRLEVYRGGDGAKAGGKGPKNYKSQKKGDVGAGRREFVWGDHPGGPSG